MQPGHTPGRPGVPSAGLQGQSAAHKADNPTETPQPAAGAKPALRRQFVSFQYFKLSPEWRRLPAEERARGKEEFRKALEEWASRIIVIPYSLVGVRADCDLMLWRVSFELEHFQEMTARLLGTGLGRHLIPAYSYLAMTKRSNYVDKLDPGHTESRVYVKPGKYKYLFVYPFVKTREWYLLPYEKRQEMMDEHIRIGNKYPSVKLNTTYSFGLDDQEFVVAFESDRPGDFLDLVMELRESQGSRYTLRDTPIFTCVRKTAEGLMEDF